MPQRGIPSLNWLRVFEAAARTESFTAAAHILNMSPSAVSQQISSLEHYLGDKLFIRTARSVRLSEAGFLFLPTVKQALSKIETSAASLFGLEQTEQATISANTIFATSWLAPRLPEFESLYPNVGLNIICNDHFDGTSEPAADIHITFGPAVWQKGELTTLFSESIYPVAMPPIAASISNPEDLAHHRLIEVSGHRQTWRLVLGSLGVEYDNEKPFLTTSNTNLAFSISASSDRIALARAPATDWLMDKYGLVPCLPGVNISGEGSYILTSRPQAQLTETTRAFRDWLIEKSQEHMN